MKSDELLKADLEDQVNPSREHLLAVLTEIRARMSEVGSPTEAHRNVRTPEAPHWVPDWRYEIQLVDNVLLGAPITAPKAPHDTRIAACTPRAIELSKSVLDAMAERSRQIFDKGYRPVYDERYEKHQLALASASYALASACFTRSRPKYWPFQDSSWKPSIDHYRNIEKSVALGLAEMDRINRARREENPDMQVFEMTGSLMSLPIRDNMREEIPISGQQDPSHGVPSLRGATVSCADQHQDSLAVDNLAKLMKEKLAKQRAKGYGGWDTDCSQERLSEMLRSHLEKGDPVDVANFCAFLSARQEAIAKAAPAEASFQDRVQPWMQECFGPEIADDRSERNHRFLEEALELVQSNECTESEAHQLVDYVFHRPVGDSTQEVGGVMVTLAALCLSKGLDMHAAGDVELTRISDPVTMVQVREKQAAKPKHLAAPSDPLLVAASKYAGFQKEFEDLISLGGVPSKRLTIDVKEAATELLEVAALTPQAAQKGGDA